MSLADTLLSGFDRGMASTRRAPGPPRGRMTACLQLLDLPAPSIHGPTAGERTSG